MTGAGPGDAAVFTYAPEVNAHEDGGDQRESRCNARCRRAAEGVSVHDGATEQRESATSLYGSHAQERAERAFVAETGVARAMFVPTVTAQKPS